MITTIGYRERKRYRSPHGDCVRIAGNHWRPDEGAVWFPDLKGGKPGRHWGGWVISKVDLRYALFPIELEAIAAAGGDGVVRTQNWS